MQIHTPHVLFTAAALAGLVTACSDSEPQTEPTMEGAAETTSGGELTSANATLQTVDGVAMEGSAQFTSTVTGVQVILDVRSAPPGKLGVHIHQTSDCSDIAGKSMGGHFAPEDHDHALPEETATRHLGDLGNIEVGTDGMGHLQIEVTGANLVPGDAMSFVDRAIVVHGGQDSGSAEQPAGASGTPIACGPIAL